MEELGPQGLEELAQGLDQESGAQEPLPQEVEDLLQVLHSGPLPVARQNAAVQLGNLQTSSPRIVRALNAAHRSDPYPEVSRAAAKSLRAPVHQEYLHQHPDLATQVKETEDTSSLPMEVRRIHWVLWLQWVSISTLGYAFLAWGSVGRSSDWPVGWGVLCLGLVWMVVAQWLVLRPRLARAGWWVLATLVGLALGGLTALFAIYVSSEWFGLSLAGLGLLAAVLVGTPVGLLQWLVLRRQARGALWWLPATVVAFGAGLFALGFGLKVLPELPAGVLQALVGAVLGAVYGAITGATLVVLLPHPVKARVSKPLLSRTAVGVALTYLVVLCLGWVILGHPTNVQHLLVQYRLGKREFSRVSFERAYLSGATLADASLYHANLREADLTNAILTGAALWNADLTNANLADADLRDAWLGDADLTNANLTDADLRDAWMGGADLTNANLTGADLGEAILSGANLSGATVIDAQLARAKFYTPATLPDGTMHKPVATFSPAVPTPAPPVRDAMRQLEPGWTSYMTGTELADSLPPGVVLAGGFWTGIATAPDGALWFSTLGGGVFHFDGETWTHYSEDKGLASDIVLSFTEGRGPLGGTGDMLWFATSEGICRFDGETWSSYPDSAYLAGGPGPTALAPDGALWYGTAKGATRYDGESWTTFTAADGLAANYVLDILVGSDGALWFGTNGGVSRFDRGFWTSFTMAHGLVHNRVTSIAVAPDGALWFGTEGGVSRFDGETWTSYSTEDGLVNNAVDAVAVTPSGVLWFGTEGGVSRFTGTATSTGDGETWTSYTSADGLVNDTVSAIEVAPDGSVWFGTEGGLSRYIPPARSDPAP